MPEVGWSAIEKGGRVAGSVVGPAGARRANRRRVEDIIPIPEIFIPEEAFVRGQGESEQVKLQEGAGPRF